MNDRYFHSSVTRISNFKDISIEVVKIPRVQWEGGDYIVGEVDPNPSNLPIELTSGRMIHVAEGDQIIGAFGKRFATLEATGNWESIADDGQMHALTGAGLFGKCESSSMLLPPLLSLTYQGHVYVDGKKSSMKDFVRHVPQKSFDLPVILITGTSMSAGKTTVARVIIRQLKRAIPGLRLIGAKLTGAGRYRDILSMKDAGADYVFDFVEVGLPSTICDEDEFRKDVRLLLSQMAEKEADVAIIEVGASPLEPYNGLAAIEALEENIRCIVLCSSDPYAVVGVISAFNLQPDLVSGVTTSTDAGIALVEKLAEVKALNVLNKQTHPELVSLLKSKIPEVFEVAV